MSDGGGHSGAPSPVHMESTTDRMAELLQFLMEDRRKREELAEERRQRAEEQRHEQEQQFLDDECQKRETNGIVARPACRYTQTRRISRAMSSKRQRYEASQAIRNG